MRRVAKIGVLACSALAVVAPVVASGGDATASRSKPCPKPAVRVAKSAGSVELSCDGELRASFAATFGASPKGPKERRGDEKTPEGDYRVTSRAPSDRFHRFVGISYPNADDLRRAKEKGIRDPGDGIGLHGVDARLAGPARAWTRFAHATGLHRLWGPTDGCVGMTNEDVEALYDAVRVGTRVVIVP